MHHNPAASFDLGTHVAAGGYGEDDIAWIAQASQMHVDRATLDVAARRFEAEFDAWLDAQIDASMR